MPRATTKESLRAELLMAGEECADSLDEDGHGTTTPRTTRTGAGGFRRGPAASQRWSSGTRTSGRPRARRRRSWEFCRDKLGFETTGNEVMATLESRALKIIMAKAPAEPGDYVGFGKHAKERYQTILAQYSDYAQWVMTMYQESGGEWRGHSSREIGQVATGTKEWSPQGAQGAAEDPGLHDDQQGHREDKLQRAEGPVQPLGEAEMHREDVDKNARERDRQMAAMAETLALLRAEVAEMKSERPRKTVAKAEDEGMTDTSFNLISDGEINAKNPPK